MLTCVQARRAGSPGPGRAALYGPELQEMGILWANNCTSARVTSLRDVPSHPGLDSAALLRLWLQAQAAPAQPLFPTLSSVGNLGAEIPLVRSGDGAKPSTFQE